MKGVLLRHLPAVKSDAKSSIRDTGKISASNDIRGMLFSSHVIWITMSPLLSKTILSRKKINLSVFPMRFFLKTKKWHLFQDVIFFSLKLKDSSCILANKQLWDWSFVLYTKSFYYSLLPHHFHHRK